jgi:Zn-finger nucleic acid-binding protein
LRPVRARRGRPETAESPVAAGDLELDRCGGCRGAWYDRDELDLLLGRDLSVELGAHRRGPSLLARCPRCGAAAAGREAACPRCGESLAAVCPRCGRALDVLPVAGVQLDVCPACGGLWLDEAEALALAAILDVRPGASSGGLVCRRCGRAGLRPAETMCTEDGLICDACHRAAERARAPAEPAGGSGAVEDVVLGAEVAAILLDGLLS